MNIELNFGRRVTVLPSAAYNKLDSATKTDIKVLFLLSGADDGIDPRSVSVEELADKLGIKVKQVNDAITFWQKAGVMLVTEAESKLEEKLVDIKTEKSSQTIESEEKPRVLIRRSDEMPSYTTEEISKILEMRQDASYLLDACQRELGKMFSTHDINIIVGMLDYLGVDMGYIVTLLKYCNSIGKRTIRYAEKLAFAFVESGIDTTPALKEKLDELEVMHTNENFVRKLFGMKARELSTKEKNYIVLWFGKFGYDKKMVERAYEITVDNTHEPAIDYTHTILSRWNSDNIRTLEDVDKSMVAYRTEKSKKENGNSSFDVEDFFASALERSYKDYKTE